MCLTLKRKFRSENEAKRFSCKTAKIATEDIKVWKCLEIKNKSITTGRAPYRGPLYKEGELKKAHGYTYKVIRVPGGWIYRLNDRALTFVPYISEQQFKLEPLIGDLFAKEEEHKLKEEKK